MSSELEGLQDKEPKRKSRKDWKGEIWRETEESNSEGISVNTCKRWRGKLSSRETLLRVLPSDSREFSFSFEFYMLVCIQVPRMMSLRFQDVLRIFPAAKQERLQSLESRAFFRWWWRWSKSWSFSPMRVSLLLAQLWKPFQAVKDPPAFNVCLS